MSSYRLFVAQYDAVVDLIKSGNHVGKKDVEGPEPPLHMPSWEGRLSDRDVEAVIAYALSEYPWEEEE